MDKRILIFGDSNTYGLRPDNGDRYRNRWPRIVGNELLGATIIEEGLCGRTTIHEDKERIGRNGAALLPVLLETHAPLQGVVLMLGTNDCKSYYGNTAKSITAGIQLLVEQIRTFDPEIKILILSPIWLGEAVWHPQFDPEFDRNSVEVSKALAGEYRRLARNYECGFLNAAEYAAPSRIDQEHLDERGHNALAKAVSRKLCLMFPGILAERGIEHDPGPVKICSLCGCS